MACALPGQKAFDRRTACTRANRTATGHRNIEIAECVKGKPGACVGPDLQASGRSASYTAIRRDAISRTTNANVKLEADFWRATKGYCHLARKCTRRLRSVSHCR